MIGALTIGLAALALAGEQGDDQVSPMIADIIAGYHAWDLSCEPAGAAPPTSCSTQSSDQVTTIRLRRTADGLQISLGSRQCPDTFTELSATLPARAVRPRQGRHDSERLRRVYSRFVRLEDQLLRSCGAEMKEPSAVYDMLMILRFVRQSDIVIAGDRN